ncbi:hypothetical protein ACIPWF_20405 [Paenarthrobacter sp. NPDC089989]|uniref:hypothetical protein n=1 Tax=unclassified Paenarthrobacter TaxID=2634190 RepID=UPI003802C386
MTSDPVEPGGSGQVHDGVSTPGQPIPRDPGSPEQQAQVPVGAESGRDSDDAADVGESKSADPPGPAEEKDDQTADDRGLTTETNPTD